LLLLPTRQLQLLLLLWLQIWLLYRRIAVALPVHPLQAS
jgi:hypothetical protein